MTRALLLLALSAQAAEPTLEDHQPLPLYLSTTEVNAVLEGATTELASCLETVSPEVCHAIEIELEIARDGAVSRAGILLTPADPALEACLQATSCALSFPARDHSADRWLARLAARDGQIFLMPDLRHLRVQRLPLFLALPRVEDASFGEAARTLFGESWPQPSVRPLQGCSPPAQGSPPSTP